MEKKIIRSLIAVAMAATTQSGLAENSVNQGLLNANEHSTIQMKKPHKYSTWLGVSLAPVPLALSTQLALPNKQGVMVESVVLGSPAEKSGLTRFDIVLSFNNQKLFSPQQLAQLVSAAKPDDEVTLSIIRAGVKQDIKVKLGRNVAAQRMPQHFQNNFGMQPFTPFQFPSQTFSGMPNFWSSPLPSFGRPYLTQPIFPNFGVQGNMPNLAPNTLSGKGGSVMQQFESISIQQKGDGEYKAKVQFQENNGEKKEFLFEGKYDEVRKQIKEAKGLPESKKNSLLNALKNNPNQLMPDGFMSIPQMGVFPATPAFEKFFNHNHAPELNNGRTKL